MSSPTLSIQGPPGRTGLSFVTNEVTPTSGGDTFLPTKGNELVMFNNGSGSSVTISIAFQQAEDGVTPAAKTIAVAAGDTVVFGPFPASYVDSGGLVHLTYSAVTSCKIMVFQPA